MQTDKKRWAAAGVLAICLALLPACAAPSLSGELKESAKETAVTDQSESSSVSAASSEEIAETESVNGASAPSASDGALVAEAISDAASSEPVYKTVTTVRVRTAPSTESDLYGSLEEGTVVEVDGEENGWYRIRLQGGLYYVRSDLIRKIEGSGTQTGKVVVIDPGHQAQGDSSLEPIGPGASKMKAKVTGGTKGRVTGLAEYELNLEISELLKDELTSRRYSVIMTRETNDVNISNSERAQIANDASAGAFLRIHANGSDNSGASGAMTICQTPSNPYNGNLYEKSRSLSQAVLDGVVSSAGCKAQSVWETDTMSGINWCKVPATIVEVGYLTNEEEEQKLATEEYRKQIATGIANGVDQFFRNN
jgi:N-acetylmuramoyl-L-alanine amidase